MAARKPPVLPGARYGRLVAIERAGQNSRGRPLWHFKCDCGGETVALDNSVKTGNTLSCGCLRTPRVTAGQRFGRLVAIEQVANKGRFRAWRFQCDCGNTTEAMLAELRRTTRPATQSCGCLELERKKARRGEANPREQMRCR
jgi:hypothetical protein